MTSKIATGGWVSRYASDKVKLNFITIDALRPNILSVE